MLSFFPLDVLDEIWDLGISYLLLVYKLYFLRGLINEFEAPTQVKYLSAISSYIKMRMSFLYMIGYFNPTGL